MQYHLISITITIATVVSLALGCGAHISVLNFFKSGLTLNPHNKHHSFGIFISLLLVGWSHVSVTGGELAPPL